MHSRYAWPCNSQGVNKDHSAGMWRAHTRELLRPLYVKSDSPLSSIVFAHRLFHAGTAWGSLCLVFRVISRSRETLTTARRTTDITFIEQSTSARSFLPRGEERRTNTRHKNSSLVRKTPRSWIVMARVSKYSEWTPQNVVTRRRLRPTFIDEVGYWK